MKNLYFLFLLLMLLLTDCNSNEIKVSANDIAIQNVNIINVENGDIQKQMTVIISGDQIIRIEETPNIRLSYSANIVDGSGKYLIPGLWDMHVHLVNESYTREVFYPLLIANGITGIRVMAADCFEPCEEPSMTITQHRNLQKEISQGKRLGPKSILASDYVNGTLTDQSTLVKPRTEAHARELARLLKERGVDFIKIYDELTPEAYNGLTDEAKKLNLDFAGHVPVTIKTSEASNAGQKSIEHCCETNLFIECSEIEDDIRAQLIKMFREKKEGNMNELNYQAIQAFDSIKCQDIFKTFIRNNTWFVPTLRVAETDDPNVPDWKDDPKIKYMPKGEFEFFVNEWEPVIRNFYGPYNQIVVNKRKQIVMDMKSAGVNLLAGSDTGEIGLIYGFSLHEELESLQGVGLSPLEALQTATINPARFQNATDSIGTIEKGKIGDLILLNENPLENINNTQTIDAVFTNGQYLNRKELDSLLLSVENYIKNEN